MRIDGAVYGENAIEMVYLVLQEFRQITFGFERNIVRQVESKSSAYARLGARPALTKAERRKVSAHLKLLHVVCLRARSLAED